MEAGIVIKYNTSGRDGVIETIDGSQLYFTYAQGQNMMCGDTMKTPQFTGHHEQPTGHSLKVPRLGDPVAFSRTGPTHVKVWGYLQHFVDLAERKNRTSFAR